MAVVALLVAAAPSPAPVAPRDCGMMSVDGQRYQVKADRIPCKRAKRWSRAYVARQSRPAGYRCRSFDSSTKLELRCSKGVRVFFAIRR